MRTPRRPLALAATFATALLGVGLVTGATPAAAAAQDTTAAVSDCGATSVGPDGMLDANLLQTCLDEVQASLSFEVTGQVTEVSDDAEEAVDEPVADEAPTYDGSGFDALDAVFSVAAAPEPAGEEITLIADNRLGGAFSALRECESGGNYSINTGNGYYGAYQFSLSTWQGLGYGGYPHQASAAVQDQAAQELQALYGWGQWPGCSWYLGL
ncbi:MAG TPA: transglycosylase family protein [Acidimicrobiales bacterium]